jgi:hypothetical protein
MTYKPNRLLGLAIIGTLSFVLFVSAVPRPVYAPPGDAWADPTCKYRIKLSFKNSESSTNLIDFQVLVVLSSSVDPQLYSRTSATDIRFYDGSTLLPKDTDVWNSGGISYVWVKVPQIDAGSNTDYIYAYYGCSGPSNPDSPTSVWPIDQYAMVLHLKEASGTRADSTSNGNGGTPTSVTKATSGQINGADRFDGTSSYITVPDASSLDFGTSSFSYSFWFYSMRGLGYTQDMLDKKGGAAADDTPGYKVLSATDDTSGFSSSLGDPTGNGVATVRVDTGSRHLNAWTMMTVVINRDVTPKTLTIYINRAVIESGTRPNPGTITNVLSVDNGYPLRLGAQSTTGSTTPTRWFQGYLDEVRVSKVARSVDWIKADYDSTTNNFVTFGSAEEGSRSIDSCDSDGVKQDDFVLSDTVNVKGTGGYAAGTTYPLYIVSDVSWSDGISIPTRVEGTETTVTSDADGNIPTTPVWSPTLKPGKYDIIIDVTNPGVYDEGIDALDDSQVQVTAGFFVIPEYTVGTILALAMCFGGVFVYRRYKHNKLKPF